MAATQNLEPERIKAGVIPPMKIGTTSNYTEFEADGTIKLVGTATVDDGSLLIKTLVLKQGFNKCGTFIANGVTPVTVNNASIAITDAIIISLNTVGGTVGMIPVIATITAATGFTVVCTTGDTSIYNYSIISNAS